MGYPKDRAYDETKTVLPLEVARGVCIKNPPSAAALKLLHLMINVSGGRMADEIQHDMRLSDIHKINGMRKHDRASITPLFAELAAAVLERFHFLLIHPASLFAFKRSKRQRIIDSK